MSVLFFVLCTQILLRKEVVLSEQRQVRTNVSPDPTHESFLKVTHGTNRMVPIRVYKVLGTNPILI